jgi:hypothetical protein
MSRITDPGGRLAVRCLGVALALASCDLPSVLAGSATGMTLVAVVAVAAWWAAPMVDARPVQTSIRWAALAARRRTTLLAAGSVAVAAATDPPVWLAACVGALLLAYLLVTDPWTYGVTAPRETRPDPAPALAAAAACAVVFLAAQAPLAHTSWARLPAALALAATTTCLALALRHRGVPEE